MSIYYIKQKTISIKDKYFIYDENKEAILQVIGDGLAGTVDGFFGNIFSMGYILHINNLDGEEQFSLKKKRGFIWENYDILVRDSVCDSIHREKNWWKLQFSISGQYGDYKLDGDVLGKDFTIIKDGETVATVKKKLISLGDTYELCVYEEGKYGLFLSIVIAIDNSCHN